MLITNKYIYKQNNGNINVYEYYGCLYSANITTANSFYVTPTYTTLKEAINDAINYLAHKTVGEYALSRY